MKYKENLSNEIKNSQNGLTIFDNNNNEYKVFFNGLNELIITTLKGNIVINPKDTYQIGIKIIND